MRKHVAVITAEDGAVSVAGPFASLVAAEGWAARLELVTSGDLSAQAVMLEDPAAALEEAEARQHA